MSIAVDESAAERLPDFRGSPKSPARPELSGWLREADAELARLGRCGGQLRLRVGELLDALVLEDGHRELGFSSLEAYVTERGEQTRSWTRETRGLARRIRERGLVRARRALLAGEIGWSMAEVLVRSVTPENEETWLAEARGATVQAVREKLRAAADAGAEPVPGKAASAAPSEDEPEPPKVSSLHRLAPAEMLMITSSRFLVTHLNGAPASDEALVTALLAEGETTLYELGGRTVERVDLLEVGRDTAACGLEALEVLRAARRGFTSAPPPVAPVVHPVGVEPLLDAALPTTVLALDAEIVRCCGELSRRDLRIGQLADALLRTRAWWWLGFESAEKYVRERLGLSLSSAEHRAGLARKARCRPEIGEALERGVIGYEGALLVCRAVGERPSAELVEAWIGRASRRTVKHLREEVDAVVTAVDLKLADSRMPPSLEDVEAVASLERDVQSGVLLREVLGLPAKDTTGCGEGSDATIGSGRGAVAESGGQAGEGARQPAGTAGPGRDAPQISVRLFAEVPAGEPRSTLRLRISGDLHLHWLALEAEFRRHAGPNVSFVAFLCAALWSSWLPILEAYDVKWKAVHLRDRHRCSSPVCERRDVTLHHLKFRSQGGTDEDENLASPCAPCHLGGIHLGRIRAEPPASNIRWTFGRTPILVVQGRERVKLNPEPPSDGAVPHFAVGCRTRGRGNGRMAQPGE